VGLRIKEWLVMIADIWIIGASLASIVVLGMWGKMMWEEMR
jgi:hypothetical protein